MEGYSRKDERCPQLLDLISKDREWLTESGEETSHGLSEERKLELRLGPPGEHWTISRERDRNNESLSSFPYFSNPPWQHQTTKVSSFLHQILPVMKESSQPCSNRAEELQNAEKKKAANTAVHNSCSAQKRFLSFISCLISTVVFPFWTGYIHFFLCIYLYMYLVVHAFRFPFFKLLFVVRLLFVIRIDSFFLLKRKIPLFFFVFFFHEIMANNCKNSFICPKYDS